MNWIKVEEGLPELSIHEGEWIANGFHMPASKRSERCLVVANGHVTESRLTWRCDYPERTSWAMLPENAVTHWMLLPPPPEQ